MHLMSGFGRLTVAAALSAGLLLMVFGCGGAGTEATLATTDPLTAATEPAVTQAGFGIPVPTATRGVDYVADGLVRTGTEHIPSSEFPAHWFSDSNGICTYLPDWTRGSKIHNRLAVAAYAFTLTDFTGAHRITFEMPQAGAATDMWVGLADWNRNSWYWHQPVDGVINTPLADCINQDNGELLIAVVFTGSDTWQIESITVGGQFILDGYVYEEDGITPLAGVAVAFEHTATAAVLTAATGADGRWSLTNPPCGDFTVTPDLEGHTFSPVSVPGKVTGLDLHIDPFVSALRPVVEVSGFIYLDDYVTPVAGVTVVVQSGDDFYSDRTDSEGYYRLIDIYGGEVTVTPHNIKYEYSPPERVLNITGDTVLEPFFATCTDLYAVNGDILRDDGVTPAVGVEVRLYSNAGYISFVAVTDADGEWVIEGVPSHTYDLYCYREEYTFDPNYQAVTVVDRDVTVDTIQAAWPAQHRLHGYVRDYDTGEPIADVQVLLYDLILKYEVFTDASGHWEVPDAYEGSYNIEPMKVPYNFEPSMEYVELTGDCLVDTFRGHRQSTCTVDGYIYEEGTATPVPDVLVFFWKSLSYCQTITDESGHYSIELPDGSWYVDPSSTCWDFIPPSRQIAVSGAPLTVDPFYVEPGGG